MPAPMTTRDRQWSYQIKPLPKKPFQRQRYWCGVFVECDCDKRDDRTEQGHHSSLTQPLLLTMNNQGTEAELIAWADDVIADHRAHIGDGPFRIPADW